MRPGQNAPTADVPVWLAPSQVVPTMYVDTHNKSVASNQYSVTEHFRESGGANGMTSARTLPGVFFFYDLSPIKVHIVERRANLFHYLTNLCAIIGGVFAISGLVDAAAYQGERLIRKKVSPGGRGWGAFWPCFCAPEPPPPLHQCVCLLTTCDSVVAASTDPDGQAQLRSASSSQHNAASQLGGGCNSAQHSGTGASGPVFPCIFGT